MTYRKTTLILLAAATTAAAQSARNTSTPRGFTPNEPPPAQVRSTQSLMQTNGGSLLGRRR